MDHVIALEWGPFPGETEAVPAESRKRNAEAGTGNALEEEVRRATLQRLEDALALPPETGISLYENAAPLQPAGDSVGAVERAATPGSAPSNQNPSRKPQSPAANPGGKYINRLMWTGQAFEERPVLIVPETYADVSQPQPAPVPETAPVDPVLKNSIVQPPLPAPPSETAAVAPELQSEMTSEGSAVDASPLTMRDHNLHTRAPQIPSHTQAASALAPTNGAKISQGQQGSDNSRWFVLNSVFNGAPAPEQIPAVAVANLPVLEVFSLAGGVGKTSLVATLGRALAARGERVLLVEAAPFGSLPYYFGARDCRPGTLRTFRPPTSSCDVPIRMVSVDTDALLAESAAQDAMVAEIAGWAEGASRVIVDVATGSAAAARALSQLAPKVLVPLVPDVNSIVAANSIDSFFQHRANATGAAPDVYYMLNQFDPSLPLHLEVAKVLQAGLGERLLPIVLERDTAVNEALADGMTIIDYAPASAVAENYNHLAEWVEHVMAPVQANPRGARWRER